MGTGTGRRCPAGGGWAVSLVPASQGSPMLDQLDPARLSGRSGAASRLTAGAL